MAQKVLVVDVGGTHLKILASGQRTPRKIASGSKMTARLMCNWVKKAAIDWQYDVAAIGYPGLVVHGDPILNNAVPLHMYNPGTWGPEQADSLATDVGGWRNPKS